MYCRRQLGELAESREKFEAAGATIVAVSTDSNETSVEFAYDDVPGIALAPDPEMTVIGAYGVRHRGKNLAVPAVFVVDRSGIVRYRRIGESISDRAVLAELLATVEGL